ncbi:MAG TPA: hypothetical protein VGP07_02600 [Polyangia bacterium]|jgi:Tol biopolymer transport system component
MPPVRLGRVLLALAIALTVAMGSARADEADDDAPTTAPIAYWRTLETPHFRIHFYEAERPLAERAAVLAEHAFASLTRYLKWVPRGRIDISLVDATDSANGFASSLPANYIYAFGVPPEPLFSLNDFDDWLNVLISHELTHVVHLDTILGLPRLVDTVFGKIVAPNLVQPNWFIEGLAVLNESRVTTAGRVRSSLYDMYLREAILGNRFHGLDAVSNGPVSFPQGEAAYLYGSHFLKYLEDRFGSEKLAELSHRYARRLLPFGLNRVAREVYGELYDQLWEDWIASMKRRYDVQVDEVSRKGLTSATRLTFDGEGPVGGAPSPGLSPHYFSDGRGVVYLRQTSFEHPAYVLFDPLTKQHRELWEAHSAGVSSPTPDGRGLVFAQVAPVPLPRRIGGNDNATWEDLFHLDLESGELRQLTHGQRAHQPDVSPDGKRIACTTGRITGTQELAVVSIDGGVPEVLLHNAAGEIAYSPSWSPDGKQIVYSRFKRGGFHDIHIFDLATRTDRALWIDRALDIEPRFSPDGRFVLWSSDRTGIYNIFAYEVASGRVFQVTNVIGGAFQPTVSRDLRTLVFSGFSADGYDLYSIPYAPQTWRPAEPFVNVRDDAPVIAADQPVPTREYAYQPWRYLYPHHWGVPTISRNDLGLGAALSFNLSMADPVQIHAINLNAQIPTGGDPSLALNYTYARFWPQFNFGLSRAAATQNYDLIIDGQYRPYRQHAIVASGSFSLPVLRRADAQGDLSFSYVRSDYGPADPLPVADPTGGITIPPKTGPDASVGLGWSYSNAHAWTRSISNQEGRTLGLNLTIADPSLGGKYHTLSADWSWREYATMPWARLQVLALLYAGGISVGDHQGYYALGGFQQQDLVRALFYQRRQCCLFLRGYPVNAVQGNQYHLLSTEYRLPLLLIEKGYSTFPLYLRQMHVAFFTDVGNAFNGDLSRHGWRTGVGGELRLTFKLGYYYESLLQFGVAKGLSKGGVTDYYWVTSFPFF